MAKNFKLKPLTGIYIHVPFCTSKCDYCSFFSLPDTTECVKLQYITRLEDQIKLAANIFPQVSKTVRTLYIGGGTPTVLSKKMLENIFKSLEKYFGILPENLTETTIEANPDSASLEKLRFLKESGFNRISLGVQSLNDKLLKTIGRVHNRKTALEALNNAVKAGFSNISADIMFGLPGQNLRDIKETLKTLLEIEQIKHLSAYSLSVEDGTKLYQRLSRNELSLPDEDLEREMQYLINSLLKDNDFKHYEISNYARPGYEAVHNSSYWDLSGYLGLGPGASSFVNGIRWANQANLNEFLKGKFNTKDGERLSLEQAKGDFMFLGLRRISGVDDIEYKELFQSSFFLDYKNQIASLIDRGLLTKEGEKLKLTPLGLDLANQVFLEFV